MKSYVEKGMLVPDHVMTKLVLPKLEQLSSHCWVLDGKKSLCFCYSAPAFHWHTLMNWIYMDKFLLLIRCYNETCSLKCWVMALERTASQPWDLIGQCRLHPFTIPQLIYTGRLCVGAFSHFCHYSDTECAKVYKTTTLGLFWMTKIIVRLKKKY